MVRTLKALLLLLLLAINTIASANSPARLVLTSKLNPLEPEDFFSCDGTQINGYLMFSEPVIGKHQLEAKWIMPNGMINQHVNIPLDFPGRGRQTAYVYFRFQDPSDGFLGSLHGGASKDSDASNSFNGPWEVVILLDGEKVDQKKFKVAC